MQFIFSIFAERKRKVKCWESKFTQDLIFAVGLNGCRVYTVQSARGVERAVRDSPVVEIHSQVLESRLGIYDRNRGSIDGAN